MKKLIELSIHLLEEAGFEAYLVGGCVRDHLLGKKPTDIDITTNATPDQMFLVFRDYNIIGTGLKHGTVTVVMEGVPIEITTYRTDGVYTDNRRPDQVRFTGDLREDLSRRDFTINAMAYDPRKKKLIDPFGGEEDLKNRQIHCVGEAQLRFEEDGLRILRALRFASVLDFEIGAETKSAILEKKELLKNISVERILIELKKLLMGNNAGRVLLDYVNVIGVVIPELLPMRGFAQNNPAHVYDVLEHTAAVVNNAPQKEDIRLAALFHDIGKPKSYSEDEKGVGHFYGHERESAHIAEDVLRRLKSDRLTKTRVHKLVMFHGLDIQENRRHVKRWLRKLGPALLSDIMLLKRADNLAQNLSVVNNQERLKKIQGLIKEITESEDCFSLADLALNGKDLVELGITEGPEIGKTLNWLLGKVIEGNVPNNKEALQLLAKKRKNHPRPVS